MGAFFNVIGMIYATVSTSTVGSFGGVIGFALLGGATRLCLGGSYRVPAPPATKP